MSARCDSPIFGWRTERVLESEILAREITALIPVQASEALHTEEIDRYNLVRQHVEDIYRHSVFGTIDEFGRRAHEALATRKAGHEGGLTALFLILLDDMETDFPHELEVAGAKAYRFAETSMGDKPWGNLPDRADTFGAGRLENLDKVPGEVMDRLQASIERGLANGESPAALQRRLASAVSEAKEVDGTRVVETEATIAMGTAIDSVLLATGKTEKRWLSQRDDRVRPTHEACDRQGWVKLGKTFSNGLRFPGDPNGPLSEIIGCRCVLVGR